LQKYNTRSSMPCATTYSRWAWANHYIPGAAAYGMPQLPDHYMLCQHIYSHLSTTYFTYSYQSMI